MKRMAFYATVDQIIARTKTVTRRAPNTWKNLEVGDTILAVDRVMGLRKGETQTPLAIIQITESIVETIGDLTDDDVTLEGFPDLDVDEFLTQVWEPLHGTANPEQKVRRIAFVYLETTWQEYEAGLELPKTPPTPGAWHARANQ